LPPKADAAADSRSPLRDLSSIVTRLDELGCEVFAVDLRRPLFGVPAVRLIAPALQLEPSDLTTPRLRAAILETGGGATYTRGEKLL
jgi:ribosomal protein S12 methylthiotransferase accessory factor